MSIRVKIARWIAPELAEKEIADEAHIEALRRNLFISGWDRDLARSALRDIASRVTPKASHTVKKMGKIAEEALK